MAYGSALSQLIRRVKFSGILPERGTGGSGFKGYSPVLLGQQALAKELTIREGYGPPWAGTVAGLWSLHRPL